MLKGAQKQMIIVRTGDSRYFDEAYFVLRREIKTQRSTRSDMLREATRILEESELDPRPRRSRVPKGVLLFLAGILCGAAVAVLICLIL